MGLYYCGNQWGYTPLGTNVQVPQQHCLPPTLLTAEVENHYVTFRWQAPHDYVRFVLMWRIKDSGAAFTEVSVAGTTYKATLTALTTYEWRVLTVCGDAPYRESLQAVGPEVRTGVSAANCTAIGAVNLTNEATRIRVSWTSTGALYYVVQLRLKGSLTTLEYTTQATTLVLTEVQEGNTYEVRVRSVCSLSVWSESPWNEVVVGTLSCPKVSAINTSVTQTAVVASWLPPGVGPYSYNVYLDGELVAALYPLTTFNFQQLTAGTTYLIEVRTNCVGGYSDPTATTVTTPQPVCTPPTGLVVTGQTLSTLTLSWTPAVGVTGQQIQLNNSEPITLNALVNEYTFGNLPSGSINRVRLYSLCGSLPSAALELQSVLEGCQPPSGMNFEQTAASIRVRWTGVANAREYRVEVRRESDNALVASTTTTATEYQAFGLSPQTSYLFEITAYCGPEKQPSAPHNGQAATLAEPVCENAVIDTLTATQTTLALTWHFASGLTHGFFEARLKDLVTQAEQVQEFAVVKTLTFTDLVPGRSYELYLFHNYGDCTPQLLQTHTQPLDCPVPALDVVALTGNTHQTLNVQVSVGSNVTSYELQYQLAGASSWTSVTPTGFVTNIALAARGIYRVRVRSLCSSVYSDWVESDWVCPPPLNVQVAVFGTTATLTWDRIEGSPTYKVVLTSLTGGDQDYSTTNSLLEITGLNPNTLYVATVSVVCANDPETLVAASPVTFQTLAASGPYCPPVPFSVQLQPCDADNGQTDSGGSSCTVESVDWATISYSIIDVDNDPPNDAYFEATFSYTQNLAAGTPTVIPGGIIAVISEAACRPQTTATLTLQIIAGGTLGTGSGTIDTSGNITATGVYTATGGTILIVKLRGNYNKV